MLANVRGLTRPSTHQLAELLDEFGIVTETSHQQAPGTNVIGYGGYLSYMLTLQHVTAPPQPERTGVLANVLGDGLQKGVSSQTHLMVSTDVAPEMKHILQSGLSMPLVGDIANPLALEQWIGGGGPAELAHRLLL